MNQSGKDCEQRRALVLSGQASSEAGAAAVSGSEGGVFVSLTTVCFICHFELTLYSPATQMCNKANK